MASLDPRFDGQFSNEWYWNPHMEPLLAKHRDKIAAWHHGHTHAAVDVVVDGFRIVTNPRGYPGVNHGWKLLTMEIESLWTTSPNASISLPQQLSCFMSSSMILHTNVRTGRTERKNKR